MLFSTIKGWLLEMTIFGGAKTTNRWKWCGGNRWWFGDHPSNNPTHRQRFEEGSAWGRSLRLVNCESLEILASLLLQSPLGKSVFFPLSHHSCSFLMIFTANLRVSILACVTGGLHTVLLNSLWSLVRSLEQIQYIPPYRQFVAVHSVNYVLYYITLH